MEMAFIDNTRGQYLRRGDIISLGGMLTTITRVVNFDDSVKVYGRNGWSRIFGADEFVTTY